MRAGLVQVSISILKLNLWAEICLNQQQQSWLSLSNMLHQSPCFPLINAIKTKPFHLSNEREHFVISLSDWDQIYIEHVLKDNTFSSNLPSKLELNVHNTQNIFNNLHNKPVKGKQMSPFPFKKQLVELTVLCRWIDCDTSVGYRRLFLSLIRKDGVYRHFPSPISSTKVT